MGIQIADEDSTAAPASSSSSRLSDAQILIADENTATLEFFSRLLEDRGFTTVTADSGEAVLQLLFPQGLGKRASGKTVRKLPSPQRLGKRIDEIISEIDEIISEDVIVRAILGYPIRVILLGDLMKPPIDGLDLIRRLRPYRIPLVVATSYGADYTLLAKMAGAEIIVHKFADPTYLITIIEQAISSHPPLDPGLTLTR
ncbi:MAG TPA: response regulator [Blastocatellia bacterium]|nr:response regulator [Blastocatellia bacterium]